MTTRFPFSAELDNALLRLFPDDNSVGDLASRDKVRNDVVIWLNSPPDTNLFHLLAQPQKGMSLQAAAFIDEPVTYRDLGLMDELGELSVKEISALLAEVYLTTRPKHAITFGK